MECRKTVPWLGGGPVGDPRIQSSWDNHLSSYTVISLIFPWVCGHVLISRPYPGQEALLIFTTVIVGVAMVIF